MSWDLSRSALLAMAILGAAATTVEARGAVTITFTSTPSPTANYAPNNVLAVWIEKMDGTYVRTLDLQAAVRTQYLLAWNGKIGNPNAEPDIISGASRIGYATATLSWNLKDKAGNLQPAGTYRIRLEQAQSNANSQTANNEGTFTVAIGGAASSQAGQSNGGFTNVTVAYDANAPACGDGIKEGTETCDPGIGAGLPGNCALDCSTTDKCNPGRKKGAAAQCNVACTTVAITTCTNFDGCCLAECDGTDSDCDMPAGGSGSGSGSGSGGGGETGGDAGVDSGGTQIGSGCSTDGGNGNAIALFGIGLGALVLRRKRR
ncbi:MAG TPA: DUF2271 domain-containing protein [Kofleriaceae bacterium]